MADIIDGRAIARQLDEKTKATIDAMVAAGQPRPGLAVILVGHDGASEVYVRRKIKACEKVGVRSFVVRQAHHERRTACYWCFASYSLTQVAEAVSAPNG